MIDSSEWWDHLDDQLRKPMTRLILDQLGDRALDHMVDQLWVRLRNQQHRQIECQPGINLLTEVKG